VEFTGAELAGSAETTALVEGCGGVTSVERERGPGEGLLVTALGTSRRRKEPEATRRARCRTKVVRRTMRAVEREEGGRQCSVW
jgi:hypothetical protein